MLAYAIMGTPHAEMGEALNQEAVAYETRHGLTILSL
jgi:hypothetical protein